MDNSSQIKWLLHDATCSFNKLSDTAKLDAELLMCHVLDCNRTYLFTWPDKTLDEAQLAEFKQVCAKRALGHPIAHIVGYREFWSLNLKVSPATLIPRPDTETLVEQALLLMQEHKDKPFLGLDLGTGTGAIALSLASELKTWEWIAADFVPEAVTLAQENAKLNQINNCKVIQSDWFENIPNTKFNLIVSNPPYIDEADPHLSQGDVRFEPLSALTAGDSGLSDIKIILSQAKQYLHDGGLVMIEHGNTQGKEVRAIFCQNGYSNVNTFKDLSANERITVGYF